MAFPWDSLRGRREEHDGILRRPVGWNEVEDPPVEGREAAAVPHGDGEEMRIADLPVADDTLRGNEVGRGEVDVVDEEDVAGKRGDAGKCSEGRTGDDGSRYDPGVRRDPDEPRLGRGAGGPSRLAGLAEPRGRGLVVNVIRPRERDEDVDVGQDSQTSSPASLTISWVIGGASSGTSKTGKPLLSLIRAEGASPRRASSESTFPMLDFRSAARLAAAR